jgi:hypothetical protein
MSALRTTSWRTLRLAVLGGAFLAMGCIQVIHPGEHGPQGPKEEAFVAQTHAGLDAQQFPRAMALLADAQARFEAKDDEGAIAKARLAAAATTEEWDAKGDRRQYVVERESYPRVVARRQYFEGAALLRQGKALDAGLVVGEYGFDADKCKDELSKPCEEHAQALERALPKLVGNHGITKLYSSLYMDTVPALETLVMWDRDVEAKRGGPRGALVQPTSRKTKGDVAQIRVDGTNETISSSSCHQVGEMSFLGRDFSIDECRRELTSFKAGHLIVNVPAAELTELLPGDRIFVVFDAKDWTGQGAERTIKSAHVVYRERYTK